MDLSGPLRFGPWDFREAEVDNPYAFPAKYMDVPIQHVFPQIAPSECRRRLCLGSAAAARRESLRPAQPRHDRPRRLVMRADHDSRDDGVPKSAALPSAGRAR